MALVAASILSLSGCAEKPTETQVSSLADFKKFFKQYPYTDYTYVSLTPEGSEQVIEATTDSNGDGVWQESDKPVAGRAKTNATKVTIVENSIQLQVFFSFYAEGNGVSLESSPININNKEALKAFAADQPVFLAVHPTKRLGSWTPYQPGDDPAVAYAYVKPAAIAEFKEAVLSVN